ncbi:hypothetical protein GCM10009624_05720 [Gordonia sinesedis]
MPDGSRSAPAGTASSAPDSTPPVPRRTLDAPGWRALCAEHTERVQRLVGPYLAARARGTKHPVLDFLFTYYSSRPAHIRRWHPGYGVTLIDDGSDDARRYRTLRGYRRVGGDSPDGTAPGITVDPAYLNERAETLAATLELLTATAARPARLGCFGLHEWAMVYRTDATRHDIPLRLGTAGTDAVVESMPLRCTHFDAFRFFTEAARPRNERMLSRDRQLADEQPGCLHATMDLYRACVGLIPLLASDLTLRAFEVALAARELDMRASPYDLRDYGYDPVPVETPAGRADYVRQQSAIAESGAALRSEIATACRELLRSVSEVPRRPRRTA